MTMMARAAISMMAGMFLAGGAVSAQQSSAPDPSIPPVQSTDASAEHPQTHPDEYKAPASAGEVKAPQAALEIVLSRGNRLTIRADGSDLSVILNGIAARTGLRVHGGVPARTVSGVYGPDRADIVLANLLSGVGANYVLAGVGRDELPRELDFVRQVAVTAGTAPQTAGSAVPGIGEPTEPVEAETGEPLGPGAIAHVPPNELQTPVSPEQEAARIQQNLEKLRHIQEQQSSPQ